MLECPQDSSVILLRAEHIGYLHPVPSAVELNLLSAVSKDQLQMPISAGGCAKACLPKRSLRCGEEGASFASFRKDGIWERQRHLTGLSSLPLFLSASVLTEGTYVQTVYQSRMKGL